MKTYSSAITDYRASGKAHFQISFLTFVVKQVDDPESLVAVHLCTDAEDVTVAVTDPDTGATDEATFAGGGHVVALGDLVRSQEVIRSHRLTLSGASDTVLDMVLGYNCREALFTWHIGDVDQDTGLLVDEPTCEFVGFVDGIDLSDGALAMNGGDGAESLIPVTVDSLASALTAKNFDMRALDVSKGRGGDLFFKHCGNAHRWRVWWGKERKSRRDGRDGGGGGKGGKGGGKDGRTGGGTGRVDPHR